jgi:beta-glucuronidase
VRLAHYPHSEEMIRLADEMGLMVWAEVPVYWTISWDNPATFANAAAQLNDLIVRDKNRASVVVWSIGNETPISARRATPSWAAWRRPPGRSTIRAWSPPPWRSTASGKPITIEDPLAGLLDLISFNEYAGWYWASNADMLDFRFDIKLNKPVVITEFGADALGGYHADADTRWSEEYQDTLYRNQFKMLDSTDCRPARDDALGAWSNITLQGEANYEPE